MESNFVSGHQAFNLLAPALGLEGQASHIKRVVIVIDAEEVLQVYIQQFGGTRLVDAVKDVLSIPGCDGYLHHVNKVSVNDRAEVEVSP